MHHSNLLHYRIFLHYINNIRYNHTLSKNVIRNACTAMNIFAILIHSDNIVLFYLVLSSKISYNNLLK